MSIIVFYPEPKEQKIKNKDRLLRKVLSCSLSLSLSQQNPKPNILGGSSGNFNFCWTGTWGCAHLVVVEPLGFLEGVLRAEYLEYNVLVPSGG